MGIDTLWTKSDALSCVEVSRGIAKLAVYRFTQLITPPDCQAGPKLVVKGDLTGTW